MSVDLSTLISDRRDKIITQYRESVNLISLVEAYLADLVIVGEDLCDIGDAWDIDTATGSQLSFIGSALGFTRTQCAGKVAPVFGFSSNCVNSCQTFNVGGFCEANWSGPDCPVSFGEYTFTDDELYRGFLKAIVIKHDADYSGASLEEAVKLVWGADAGVATERPGTVQVFTGRALTTDEISILHLYRQVLPVAPGVRLEIYETTNGPIFGFGTGWGGFCDGAFPTLAFNGA